MKKRTIQLIGVGVVVLAISCALTIAILAIIKPFSQPGQEEPKTTSELRQSGIEKVEQGKTEEGIDDLQAALDKARQEDDAGAVTDIEQQIDFASKEPTKAPDETPSSQTPDPMQVVTPTINQGSATEP